MSGQSWLPRASWLVGLLIAYPTASVAMPQMLFFPYQAQIGTTRVYAESPIDRVAMAQTLARADARLATSPLDDRTVGTRLFLTDGGWRWQLLSFGSRTSLALTRPMSDLMADAVIVNRRAVAIDGAASDGIRKRRLSSVVAHERTHMLVRVHLGWVRALTLPLWKSEGYADYVAGDSTLSAAEAERLRAAGSKHMALAYYDARLRVTAALAKNGGDVRKLLREP
ncbi:MAG: hypothetical protein C0500_09935 [Sphingobium sp.]|nr:hypothetical protein [Sphingobium sp.]